MPVKGRSLLQTGVGKRLLAEWRQFLRCWSSELRFKRDYSNLLDAEASGAIVEEMATVQVEVARVAYTAEQADREALALLEKAKLGGLDAADLPLLEQAIRHISRSAEGDRNISEALSQ